MASKSTKRRSTQKSVQASSSAHRNLTPKKQGLAELITKPGSVIKNNNNSNEPSFMSQFKIALSPFRRYYQPGVLSEETSDERQKVTNKCPAILSPLGGKKLWALLLEKNRLLQSLALESDSEEDCAFSKTAIEMFPLKNLVTNWEPFIKNLFAVARFKQLSRCFWENAESRDPKGAPLRAKFIEESDKPNRTSTSTERSRKRSTGRSKSVKSKSCQKDKRVKGSKQKVDRAGKSNHAGRNRNTSKKRNRNTSNKRSPSVGSKLRKRKRDSSSESSTFRARYKRRK